MTLRVGVNGFGRIGRYALRAAMRRGDVDIVAVNSRAESNILAHLFQYDSIHGTFDAEINFDDDAIYVDSKEVRIFREVQDVSKLPWGDLDVDVVLESTGIFRSRDDAAMHLSAGARKVIIAAPGKEVDITIVMGVNQEEYLPDRHDVISNASCTTNALAPIIKILNDAYGINRGLMTTIHSYTMDQRLLDGSHKDLRRARASAMNIVPTTTGAAKAVGEVIPDMQGKLDGLAMRVPTPNVSLVDLVTELKSKASIEDINNAVREASENRYKGIVLYTEKELVSVDYQSSPYSAIFDAPITYVVDGMLAKVMAWYDNESGYTERLLDLACYIGEEL